MERKGGCCLAPTYGGAAAGQAWQRTGSNAMLKFRPIAPKPAAMAPAAPMPPPPVTAHLVAPRKGKRKAAAGGGTKRGRKPKKATTTVAPATQKEVDLRKEDKPLSSPSSSSSGTTTSVDSSTPPPPPPAAPTADLASAHVVRHVAALRPLRPVASCVTIESVTGTWRDGEEAPSAAAACGDEAPAFVSDQWGRVTWMNLAFSRAVSAAGDAAASDSDAGAGVVLAAKDGAAVPAWGTCAGFTCRARVTYAACPRKNGSTSLVAPCDVWRLDAAGCYLWRLDLQATLTLSLGGLL